MLKKYLILLLLILNILILIPNICYADTNHKYNSGTIISPQDANGNMELNQIIQQQQQQNNNIASLTDYSKEYTWKYLLDKPLDQGYSMMCVAFSLREIKNMLGYANDNPDEDHSSAFIYSNRLSGDYQNEGMSIYQALKGLRDYGTCLDSTFPDISDYPMLKSKINQNMIDEASRHKIDGFIRLYTENEVKTALINVSPIIIMIPVYSSFNNGGILSIPDKSNEAWFGNHALTICGYRYINNNLYWLVLNSYGDWGSLHGYCYMPANYPIYEYWAIVDTDELKDIIPDDMSVSFNKDNIYVEDEVTYNVNINYKDLNINKNITNLVKIESLNSDLLEVKNNKLIAKSTGEASVKITYKSLSKTYKLNILTKPVPIKPSTLSTIPKIDHISITNKLDKIFMNENIKLCVNAYYNDGSIKDISDLVIWSTSNNKLGKIENGNFVGLKEGYIKLTAKYNGKTTYVRFKVIDDNNYYTVKMYPVVKSNVDRIIEDLMSKGVNDNIIVDNNKIYIGRFSDSKSSNGLYLQVKKLGYKNIRVFHME